VTTNAKEEKKLKTKVRIEKSAVSAFACVSSSDDEAAPALQCSLYVLKFFYVKMKLRKLMTICCRVQGDGLWRVLSHKLEGMVQVCRLSVKLGRYPVALVFVWI